MKLIIIFIKSLEADQQKENSQSAERTEQERLETIRQQRLQNVSLELDLNEAHIVITIRHLSCGNKTRIFKHGIKLAEIYGWAGSFTCTLFSYWITLKILYILM